MEESPILKVSGLKTAFITSRSSVEAVKGVSFELNSGHTLGIVGESGSGKSVTALSLMKLISAPGKITHGTVQLKTREHGEVSLHALSESEIRKYRGKEIAMIFQEPMTFLNPVYSCGFQVSEALQLHLNLSKAEAKNRTLELFRQVDLPRVEQVFDAYPHQISGGQKQRVMIAMAMSCNPGVLIADEPTTALDVTVQKRILELMAQLQADKGMAMIFITHDLGVVAEIADDILVMKDGKVVEFGSVKEIFNAPKHPYTKGLLACRPNMEVTSFRLPTVEDFEKNNKEKLEPFPKWEEKDEQEDSKILTREDEIYSQEPLLKVNNLATWFPVKKGWFNREKSYVKAVDDVSFEVFPGETLGLVGESGCGKTTLGRSILRLIEPTQGEVNFDGKDLRKSGTDEMRKLRKRMQIIFQDPYSSLNPRMTIGEAILEPMGVHSIGNSTATRKDKVIHLLEKVNLKPEHYHRFPHEFSGGQRQRICIARALAVEPEFIICDESVSALDVSVQAQVLNLLKDLQRDFLLTYVFISHDLSVVKFMSDRIMVMRAGKIVEIGSAEKVCMYPESAYTKELIAAVPLGTIARIDEVQMNRAAMRQKSS